MDLTTEVLIEVQRLQTLIFAHDSPHHPPRTLCDLAEWLRVPPEEADLIAEELADEGLLSPLPIGAARFHVALQLTDAGEGLLEWFQRRSMAPPRPKIARTDPLLLIQ